MADKLVQVKNLNMDTGKTHTEILDADEAAKYMAAERTYRREFYDKHKRWPAWVSAIVG